MPKITVYSTPTCHYCKDAKEFLSTKGFLYDEHNVAKDLEKRNEMVEISGGRMVPVIKVNEHIFVGFDKFKEAVDKGLVLS